MAGSAAWAGLDLCGSRADAAEDHISHTAEAIHQEPVFPCSRKRLYTALMDARQFGQVIQLSSGAQSSMALGKQPVVISRNVGGTFAIFGGHIVGRHLELVPDQRIVQAWRVVDWTPGVYSIARFDLTEQGSGSKIVFDHTGFPEHQAEHLASGWTEHYWEPLRKYLA